MEKVLLIVIFTLELSKYLMGNKLVFHHGNPVRGMICNGFVLMILYTIFTALVPQSVLLDMVVVHGIIGLIVWFAIRRSDVQGKVLNLICLGVIAYCINKSIYPLSDLFEQHFAGLTGAPYWRLLLESAWGMIVVVVLGGLAQKRRAKYHNLLSPATVTYLLMVVVLQTLGIIMGIMVVSGYIDHVGVQRMLKILVASACATVCFLIWILMYFRRQRENVEEELTLSEKLRETESTYYQVLLEKEEGTRCFRHDIKNHIFCMNQLLEEGRQEEAREYLQTLSSELGEISKRNYATQNTMFDAILHDKLRHLDDDVEVSVCGYFTEQERMELYDFCLVFSNLLTNAVEELIKVREQGRQGFLTIDIRCAQEIHEVKIRNSIACAKDFNRQRLPETDKHDKRNHGFGLKKVQQVIGKYQGDLKMACTEEAFEVIVRY